MMTGDNLHQILFSGKKIYHQIKKVVKVDNINRESQNQNQNILLVTH